MGLREAGSHTSQLWTRRDAALAAVHPWAPGSSSLSLLISACPHPPTWGVRCTPSAPCRLEPRVGHMCSTRGSPGLGPLPARALWLRHGRDKGWRLRAGPLCCVVLGRQPHIWGPQSPHLHKGPSPQQLSHACLLQSRIGQGVQSLPHPRAWARGPVRAQEAAPATLNSHCAQGAQAGPSAPPAAGPSAPTCA